MPRSALYLRSKNRRPILRKDRWIFADVQGRLPVAWCQACGTEIFDEGQWKCERCKRRKEYDEIRESMCILPANEGSGGMRQ